MFHDRVSGRLGTSDVDVIPGNRRKADKENPLMSCNLKQPKDCLPVAFTGSSSINIGFP